MYVCRLSWGKQTADSLCLPFRNWEGSYVFMYEGMKRKTAETKIEETNRVQNVVKAVRMGVLVLLLVGRDFQFSKIGRPWADFVSLSISSAKL